MLIIGTSKLTATRFNFNARFFNNIFNVIVGRAYTKITCAMCTRAIWTRWALLYETKYAGTSFRNKFTPRKLTLFKCEKVSLRIWYHRCTDKIVEIQGNNVTVLKFMFTVYRFVRKKQKRKIFCINSYTTVILNGRTKQMFSVEKTK